MKSFCVSISVMLLVAVFATTTAARASEQASIQTTVRAMSPTLLPFDGTLRTPAGEPRVGTVILTVSLYSQRDDTTPLWTEQQTIVLGAGGRYSLLAGATRPEGVPQELLSGATPAHWIGIGVQGELEQFRTMLVTVPYAARAHEADTLAGRPASDFLLSADLPDSVRASLKSSETRATAANGTNVGIGTSEPATASVVRRPNIVPRTQVTGTTIATLAGSFGIAVDAATSSGGEAVYAECTQPNNNCYALEGYAPTGDYAGYMYGGKGVYAESDDTGFPGVDARAYGSGAYALSAESIGYRAGYIKSDSNSYYSLFVDTADGPTQATAGLNVRGTIRAEGNIVASGSKAGYVVDIMQNLDSTPLEPGDVVVIAGSAPPVLGQIPVVTVRKATSAYDTRAAGVVDVAWYAPDTTTKAAYELQEQHVRAALSLRLSTETESGGKTTKPSAVPMPEMKISDAQGTLHALSGIASVSKGGYLSVVTLGSFRMVKVDASFGAIHPGDLLTTSSNPGYAMKATDKIAAIGAIVGKALGNLESGTGTMPIMVTLR